MDQIKIGKLIAELRRREGLTQEALGKRIGVTNKTISRWENGNYMPDIEMFGLLAETFGVSIEELLDGTERSDAENRNAEKKKSTDIDSGTFSSEEKKIYYNRKWRREHISLYIILFIIAVAAMVIPFLFQRPEWLGLVPIILFVEYGYQNNQMMIYVENHLYGQDTIE